MGRPGFEADSGAAVCVVSTDSYYRKEEPAVPMPMRKYRWVVVMAAVLVAGCDRGQHPGQIGKAAPLFTVTDGAQTVDLGKLRGRVVVLNFWATWCPPCIEELPSLLQMQQQMPQVTVAAISTDEDEGVYRKFLADHHVNLLTVRDDTEKANALYGSFIFPETYVIDKRGIVRRKFISAQNWTSPEILDYLTKLSNERP
jgi:cytochrome c biogenesis protein CcmG/thiol:disulfide interchange protein DsbE